MAHEDDLRARIEKLPILLEQFEGGVVSGPIERVQLYKIVRAGGHVRGLGTAGGRVVQLVVEISQCHVDNTDLLDVFHVRHMILCAFQVHGLIFPLPGIRGLFKVGHFSNGDCLSTSA